MKYLLSAVMAAGWFCLAAPAFAQSNTAPPMAATPAAAASSAPTAAPEKSGNGGKRAECMTAVQGKTGEDRQDQFQLCIAQGRVECLKQAIDQKVVGPKRKDFVKSRMRED